MSDEFGLPGTDDFLDLNQIAVDPPFPVGDGGEVTTDAPDSPSPRPPGPGLPESLLWTLGVFIALIIAGIGWTVLFMVVQSMLGHGFSPDIEAWMSGMSINSRIMLLLPPSLVAFLMLIPLGLWRLGRHRLRKLNLSPPSVTQLVIVLAAVYPTTIISTPVFGIADAVWTDLSEGNGFLEAFNEQTSVMKMMEQLEGGSLVLLLFFLALVPAVGEEFMFRGVIGRGLTARWGIWWGVLMTSCLFAVLHTYPPHIAAVLPIGVMMHVVYLTTRSFWAPVLFHFCNNAMAATYLALGLDTEEQMPLWLPLAALAYLAVSIVLLYHYRTRYLNEQDEEIGPEYVTVSAPPPDVAARRFAPVGWIAAPLFALVLAGTAILLVGDVLESMDQEPEPAGTETVLHADCGRPDSFEATPRSLNGPFTCTDGQIDA